MDPSASAWSPLVLEGGGDLMLIDGLVVLSLIVSAAAEDERDHRPSPDAIEGAIAALGDHDWAVANSALVWLGERKILTTSVTQAFERAPRFRDASKDCSANPEVCADYLRALRAFPSVVRAREAEICQLASTEGDLGVRLAAIATLGAGGPSARSWKTLVSVLAIPDDGLQAEAAHVLPLVVEDPKDAADLRPLLAHSDPRVRLQAVIAAGFLGDRAASVASDVLDRLGDEDPLVRGRALDFFADVASVDPAYGAKVRAIAPEDLRVRCADAAHRGSRDEVRSCLSSPTVGEVAIRVLASRAPTSAEARSALLWAVLEAPDEAVRAKALEALARAPVTPTESADVWKSVVSAARSRGLEKDLCARRRGGRGRRAAKGGATGVRPRSGRTDAERVPGGTARERAGGPGVERGAHCGSAVDR